MSISEIERFGADLKLDAALRAEAEARAKSPAEVVTFAAAKGYDFTVDELAEVAADNRGKRLADTELEGVAGGVDPNLGGQGQQARPSASSDFMLRFFVGVLISGHFPP